jgi:GMP synthase (glutamine-hydrolysing)
LEPPTKLQEARLSGEGHEREKLICTVIRHVEIEDLGYLGLGLQQNGIAFEYIDAQTPNLEQLPLDRPLIVLGGPMSAYEADAYPFLQTEIDFIQRYLDAARPVLGICLGAQLIAAAASAAVYPGAHGKEIGWADVQLTDAGSADPIWAGFPNRFATFHWHSDSFDLPDGAVLLGTSDRYPQAFRLGANVYAVQFHPEVVPPELESWIQAYHLELERERLTSEHVLAVPDAEEHRRMAFLFGENIARWLNSRPPTVEDHS